MSATDIVRVVSFGPQGAERVAANDVGDLVAFGTEEVALAFAHRLSWRASGLPVQIRILTLSQVAGMLAGAGKDEHALALVEAQATSSTDAIRWARELADRVPLEPAPSLEPE